MTSSPLFSSSGCAVVCMKMPTFDKCRRASPSATWPCSSSSGTTCIWPTVTIEKAARAIKDDRRRRFIILILQAGWAGGAHGLDGQEGQDRLDGRREGKAEVRSVPPVLPVPPIQPGSESEPETQLEFPLLVPRWVREQIWILRDVCRRIPLCVDDLRRRDPRELLRVEDILQLRDDFGAHRSAKRNPARVPQIHVLPNRQIERIARDEQRTIAAHAVAVQIAVRRNVHRQPAVELQQHADLITAEQLADDRVRRVARRDIDDVTGEIR